MKKQQASLIKAYCKKSFAKEEAEDVKPVIPVIPIKITGSEEGHCCKRH